MNNENFNDEKLRGILNQKVTSKVSAIGKDLMEFRSSFQQSAQTIIDHVGTLLNTLEDELLGDFREEITRAEQGIRDRLEPELRNLVETEARQRFDQELQEQLSASKKAAAEADHQKWHSKLEVLSGALREIGQQQAQVEILTCFLDKAAVFAERVAFFVVKSGSVVGWQARGFEGEFKNESIKTLVFPPTADNLFRQVSESKLAIRGNPAWNAAISETASKFGQAMPELVYVAPLAVRGKTVALLYADSGMGRSSSLDCHALEILVTGVSLTVELSSARAKLGLKPAEAAMETAPQAATSRTPSLPERPMAPARPAVAPAPPAVAEKEHKIAEVPVPSPLSASPAVAEKEHEIPEVPVAVEPPKPEAPAAVGSYFPAPAARSPLFHEPVQPKPMAAPPPSPETLSEAAQKLHNDARRFARLLVSEIKLYNEQKVLEGRRERNLYGLLRDDIDKSRQMYDKRVSSEVAARVDYFYEELVRILAENQVQALGKDCPGPVVLK